MTKEINSKTEPDTDVKDVRKRGSGAQQVFEKLRRDILCLDLKPGKSLDESKLSQKFGMSRSPIREALIRLSMEGLVVTLPNKSSVVAPLNIEEYPAYLDALDLVERVIARLAARLRSESDLKLIVERQADFLKALDAGDVPDMIDTNREFHIAISKAAKNKYFNLLHGRLLDDGRRTLHLYFRSFGTKVPKSIRRDHDLIIKAIKNQDENLAEKCAHDHVTEVGERFIEYLKVRHTLDFDIDPPT